MNTKRETVIVMDYTTGEITLYSLPEEYQDDTASFVYDKLRFKESEVSYMVVDKFKFYDYREW